MEPVGEKPTLRGGLRQTQRPPEMVRGGGEMPQPGLELPQHRVEQIMSLQLFPVRHGGDGLLACPGTMDLGQGHNALAALITRGLAELTRLAVAMGGQRETLSGLAGLGDLVLTCTGALSRNRHVGAELARGRSLAEVVASTKMVAEGVRTTEAALALGARYAVELPITEQMAHVLSGRKEPPAALRELMGRRQKAEHA